MTGCEDCPCFYFDKYTTADCSLAGRSVLSSHPDDPRWDQSLHPAWCPLRQGTITLRLKNDNNEEENET